MQRHHRNSNRRRAWCQYGASALRWLLLLAVWQGPIPWCHCHGTLANAEKADAIWLANHLMQFHPSVSVTSDVFLSWHWHTSFPGKSTGDSSGEENPNPVPLPPSHLTGCTSAASVRVVDWISPVLTAVDGQPSRAVGIAHVDSRLLPSYFLAEFAPSLPLPLRLGVARC